jgi:hypothetical protein
MPDLPISALPAVVTPNPSDVFAIVNGGITKKITVQSVSTNVFNNISSSVILPNQTGSFTTTSSFNSLRSLLIMLPAHLRLLALSTALRSLLIMLLVHS